MAPGVYSKATVDFEASSRACCTPTVAHEMAVTFEETTQRLAALWHCTLLCFTLLPQGRKMDEFTLVYSIHKEKGKKSE